MCSSDILVKHVSVNSLGSFLSNSKEYQPRCSKFVKMRVMQCFVIYTSREKVATNMLHSDILIKHVSGNKFASGDKAKCTGSRNSKSIHCLTAKELTDATTKNCQTICKSAIRCLSSTLELQLPSFILRIQNLTKSYCTSIP